jgi:hypothetical protein
VKRIVIVIIVLAVVGGGIFLLKKHDKDDAKPAGDKAAAAAPGSDEPPPPHVSRDANGRVTVNINDEAQGNMGLKVEKPEFIQLSPEVKGYGRVLDPTALAGLVNELATAQVAFSASGAELQRLKTLSGEGNASPKMVQAAEAAAMHDQLAMASARDRIVLAWSKAVADQSDLPAFVQALTSQNAALVRIDLPAGDAIKGAPAGARIVSLAGNSADAEFLGAASSVDPQTQGQGFVFIIKANTAHLLPSEAVTGYLKLGGEQVSGAVIPRDAVIRTEGSSWVYVWQRNREDIVRTKIPLERPIDTGWVVTSGVTTNDYIVTVGAQSLLSLELKPAGPPD